MAANARAVSVASSKAGLLYQRSAHCVKAKISALVEDGVWDFNGKSEA